MNQPTDYEERRYDALSKDWHRQRDRLQRERRVRRYVTLVICIAFSVPALLVVLGVL